MKKTAVVLLVLMFLASVAYAEQTYDVFNNRWVIIPDGQSQHYEQKYNAFENSWSVQPKDSNLQYNPFNNRFEWDSGRGNERRTK